ncbi:hypothetical protein ACOMHN_040236 [Nucella lapillus]
MLPQREMAASWSYSGDKDGVQKWAVNYPNQCDGQKQSPIDLHYSKVSYDSGLGAFSFKGFDDTTGVTWSLSNNGHAAQVSYLTGTLEVSGGSLPNTFRVAQFHFHWGSVNTQGSEHTVDGNAYPMEVHIVCFNTKYADLGAAVSQPDGLAVLGFFFEISAGKNLIVEQLVNSLPMVKYAGNSTSMQPFALNNLMAGVGDYYRYSGGLTTPTCNEVVTWTVFKNTIKISNAQMQAFRMLKDTHNDPIVDNYRPVQQLNNRSILANFDDDRFPSASACLVFNSLVLASSLFLSLWLRL